MRINTGHFITRKVKTLPEYLIYHNRKKDSYTLFSTKTGDILGKMQAYPDFIFDDRTYYPKERGYTSFFISNITAYTKRKGVGTALINLAKRESIRRNCEGKIHLIAKNITKDADNLPILFYRKLNFSSQYRGLMENIDAFLKGEKELSPIANKSIPMFMQVDYYCNKFNRFCRKRS